MIVRFVLAFFTLLSVCVLTIGGWFATDMFYPVCGNARDYSAFIAFTITVNFALVVHRVRNWLFRSLRQVCNNQFVKAQSNGLKSLSENTGKMVCGYTDVLQYVLRRRLDYLAWIAIVGGPICAAIGIFLLIADVPRSPAYIARCLPSLLLPSCIYYVATLLCYVCMIDHYNQICKGYVLYAKSKKNSASTENCVVSDGTIKDDGTVIKGFTSSIVK